MCSSTIFSISSFCVQRLRSFVSASVFTNTTHTGLFNFLQKFYLVLLDFNVYIRNFYRIALNLIDSACPLKFTWEATLRISQQNILYSYITSVVRRG